MKKIFQIISLIILALWFAYFMMSGIYFRSDMDSIIEIGLTAILIFLTGSVLVLILLKKRPIAFYTSIILSLTWWVLFFVQLLPSELKAGKLDPGYTVVDTFMIGFWVFIGLGYSFVTFMTYNSRK